MIKKLTSILLVVMLLATLTPSVIFAAETTEEILFTAAAETSAGGNSASPQAATARYLVRGGTGENLRHTYISFDLSGSEAKILAASEIKLVLYCTRYSGEEAQNFNVYLLPSGKADYVNSDLTHNIATENNMSAGGELVASNTTQMSQYTYYTSGDMASYLKSALADSADSKIAFRLDGTDTKAQSFNKSNHKLQIKYDDALVTNESYVSNVADLLDWTKLSSETTDSVTQNLALPTKFCGADVTWASDDVCVSSDGTVAPAKGDARNVTLTANISYNGAVSSKTFSFTVPSVQGTTEIIDHSQKTHIRGGQYADSVQAISYGEIYVQKQEHKGVNDRYAFYQFDLSGYEEKIYRASSATITVQSQYASQPVTINLLPDSCDNWSASSLTFNTADSMGMLANTVPNSERAVQNGIEWSANTAYTTNNFASLLKSSLAENPTNSLFTFRVYGDNTTLTTIKHASFKLNLTYYEDELDKNTLFNEVKDILAWDDITTQSADNVTESLKLPSKFFGFDLSWQSDNAAIDASTGKVTRSKTGTSVVNLTATITNGDASYDKIFTVTVPEAEKTSFTLNIADKAATRGGEYGNSVQDLSYNVSFNRIYTRKEGHNDANDRYIYYSFDLSGYEEEFMKASDVTFTMNNQTSGNTFSISVLPKTDYNWEYETLTYNKSNALGMMDTAYTIATGAICKTEAYTTDNFADTVKAVLASNPTSSVITIRLYADIFSEAIEFNAPSPKLNIGYYAMDIDNDAFFAEVKDDLAWDDITTQAQDSVIADLKLPSKLYGYDITWASDDEAINSAGEVVTGAEAKAVKLSYTVSDGTNSYNGSFDVTVSNKNYALGFSNAAGSAAKIYSSTEAAATLVFAAYNDNQLVSVDAVSVTVADGENVVNSVLKTANADEIKIMLLSDMNSITPLCDFVNK